MRIAVLGASGNAGRAVCRSIHAHTPHDLLLLGRDPVRLDATLHDLGTAPGTGRLTATPIRTNAPDDVRGALQDVDLLLVAAPVSGAVGPWARAAIEAGCDWFDVTLSAPAKWSVLRGLEPSARTRGCCFVTDGGVHPGLPGALARLAAGRMETRNVRVAMRFAVPWSELGLSPATVSEFAQELLHYEPRILRHGRWARGWRHARTFDFGPPLGSTTCAPMFLEELAEAHEALPDVTDMGFWVAGFGAVVDYLVLPAATALARLGGPGRVGAGRLLERGLGRFAATAGPSVVVLEADASQGPGLRLVLSSDDAYALTAAPAVATILQWDALRRPGLMSQAMCVDPERLVSDLPGLGVSVREG